MLLRIGPKTKKRAEKWARWARAEALVFALRGRYWSKKADTAGMIPGALATFSVAALGLGVSAGTKLTPPMAGPNSWEAKAFALQLWTGEHSGWWVAIGLAGLACVAVKMGRQIRAAGARTEEKRKIEAQVAELRGWALAQKEAELLAAATGLGANESGGGKAKLPRGRGAAKRL
jgi:hypothetical protein